MAASSEPPRSTTIPIRLTQIAEKKLPKPCKPGGLKFCPPMNLVAVTTTDEQVNVYRLNGQHVLGGVYGTPATGPIDNGEEHDYNEDDDGGAAREVEAVAWKPDGKYLAVVDSHNVVRIISTTSGKTVHQLPCGTATTTAPASPSSAPACLAWTSNFTDEAGSLNLLRDNSGNISLESLLSCEAKISDIQQLKGNLPRELLLLDVESSLPKLSTLPSTHDDSRNSIDAIFHGKKELGDTVDVLVVAHVGGTINLKIYNCFDIGTVDFKDSLKPATQAVPVAHASHPLTSTHAFLYHLPQSNRLRVIASDFNFITVCGRYLSLLASKVTQLQNILRYIKQVQTQILLEWRNTQDLPARYLRSVNMDLTEKMDCDFTTAAYHLVATGDCWPPLREFLVDIVGDRGHKRWDKAVSTGYESVRKYTHDCLLPALERATVHVNTLIGLSKFHKLNGVLGLWTDDLQACQETIDVLTVFAHKVIVHSTAELRGFTAFSWWLKLQIDLQLAEPLSQTQQDLMMKSDSVDYDLTLEYLTGPLTRSALRDYLPLPGTSTPADSQWAVKAEKSGSFYERYKQALLSHEEQLQQKAESGIRLPYLTELTSRLSTQFDVVLQQTADAQRKKIYHRCLLELPDICSNAVCDMTLAYECPGDAPVPSIHVAARLEASPDTFHLYRIVLGSKDGKSTARSTSVAAIQLGSGSILSLKLLDIGTIFLLWQDNTDRQATHLLQFSQDEPALHGKQLNMKGWDAGDAIDIEPVACLPLTPEGNPALFVRHSFPPEEGFKAAKLEVSRQQGRQVICVLSAGDDSYRVFDTTAN